MQNVNPFLSKIKKHNTIIIIILYNTPYNVMYYRNILSLS